MKLTLLTAICALSLFAASCAHKESAEAQHSDVQVAIAASFDKTIIADSSAISATKTQTRATATAFQSGDLLGLYAVKSGGELSAASNLINNHQLKVSESGAITGDLLPAYYPDKSSSIDLFSYYPYQSGNATADALGVLVGIRTLQTDFSSLQASDLCYGRKLSAAPSAAAHSLQFIHSFAQLRLNFSLYEGCSAIATVKLLSIKDSAKLNLQTGVVTLLDGTNEISAYANGATQFTAIIPAQSLNGACVEITLTDGTIYYYHATAPVALKASATNTLNLNIYSRTGGGDPTDPDPGPDPDPNPESDKGGVRLAGAPAITAWGVEATASNISQATDNAFTFYWSPAITSFSSINKAFITLTNPTTKRAARIEATAFVRDALSTAENATFRFAITRADAESMGYPVSIDKLELFNGGTAVHTLTDYYGRTVTRPGAHTFGTVTSLKLSPEGDWLGVANTAQSRAVVVTTTGNTSWVATAAGAGLTVSPATGSNSSTATIKWAAQLTTGDSPARSGTVTFTTVPAGVSYVVSTSQLMGPYYLAVTPATAWADVANTLTTRSHTIATGNIAGWTATATSTPTAGLTVTASGTSTNGVATPAVATWAAQAVGALARSGSITISPNPASTAAPITINTNQVAGPVPTLTLALTDAIDNPIPAGGKTYRATITSNHAWTASALTNLTIDKNKGAAGVTAVVVTIAATTSAAARAASVVFTTDAVPSTGKATQTWSGSQGAAIIVLDPAGDWANVANTQQTKAIKVTTAGVGTWSAVVKDNSGANALSVTASGNSGGNASIVWLAQAVGALARTGTVTFSSGVATPVTINTSQVAGPAPTLTLSATSPGVTIPAAGAVYTITVTSNFAWTASGQTNVTLDKTSGAAGATTVKVTIAATNTAAARAASVVFKTNAVPSTAVANATWSGSQGGATLSISPAGDWAGVANTAQTRAITVTTAGVSTWTAAATGTGLNVTASGSSGGNASVTWAAQAVGATARSGSVKFSSGSATPITINTNQVAGPAPTLTLSPTAPGVTIPNTGGTYTTTLSANTAWTATATNATLSAASGSAGNITLTITVPAAVATSTRTVSVSVTTSAVASGVVATAGWSGSQAALIPSMSISPTGNWTGVANTAQSKTITVSTLNLTGWTASASGVGLSISSTSGTSGKTTVATWAAQAVGATARSGSVTFNPNPTGQVSPITINTDQVAGPAPTLTLALTDAIPNPISAGGATYRATITSNTAWTASALTNVTLDKTSGAAGATAVVVTVPATIITATRAVSVLFKTNAVPSTATASQTWSGTQAAIATLVIDPVGNWANVVNTAQTRSIKVTTTGISTWTAAATGTGLSVTASGSSGGNASVAWAAQAVGAVARSGSVKFSSGSAAPITIATNQVAGPAPTVTLSPTAPGVTIPNTGGTYTTTLSANTAWTATATNATLSAASGSAGNITLTITVPAAVATSTRAVSVSVTTSAVASGVVATAGWSGSQAALIPSMSISPTGNWTGVANTAQSKTITISTLNLSGWTASASGVGLSINSTSGTSGKTTVATWAAQAVGATARSGSVTFNPNPTGQVSPITITTDQVAGPAPTLTLSSYAPGVTVPKAGGTYYTTVYSNTSWSSSGTNATITPSSGSGNVSVTISIPATSESAVRNISAGFATNGVPSGATASQTWSGTQETAVPASAVNINGVWWALTNAGSATWYNAPALCTGDWRLPSLEDFQNLIASGKMSQVTGISSGNYWSSTAHPDYTSHAYHLNYGLINFSLETRNYNVRCCR